MSYARCLMCGLLWLPPVASRAVAQPTPAWVQASASAQAGVVGRPIAIRFRVVRPAGAAVSWRLVNHAFDSVALLKAETRRLPGDTLLHEVVFTAAKGGRCELGPFGVLVQGAQRTDTLLVPALRVQFRAEALRTSLHPVRPNAPAWQSPAPPWGWALASVLVLSAGLGGVRLWQARRGAAAMPAPGWAPAQAQQLALAKIAGLEQAVQAKSCPQAELPDQLWRVVNEYFTCLYAPPLASENPAPAPAAAVARPVLPAALLAELAHARFAPAREVAYRAEGLLAIARQLVAEGAQPLQTAPAPL